MIARYRLTILALLAMTSAPVVPVAAFDQPQPADIGMVQACLDLAARNAAARGPHPPDELAEKPGPVGRLASAAQLAPTAPESCIGVVWTKCVQAKGTGDDASESGCALAEGAVWDQRLNTAYKAALDSMEADAAANLRKVQRSWIAWRDASCAQPYLTFQGSMAGPMEAWCEMNLTARQALWMEGWTN